MYFHPFPQWGLSASFPSRDRRIPPQPALFPIASVPWEQPGVFPPPTPFPPHRVYLSPVSASLYPRTSTVLRPSHRGSVAREFKGQKEEGVLPPVDPLWDSPESPESPWLRLTEGESS